MTLSKEELRSLRDYAVDQSLETIRNRIDQFGVSEPIIQREGQQDILIQLPGIQDPERAKEIIGKTALLEFKLVDDTANVEDAMKNGPPPGRQMLYGYAGKGEGGVGGDKTAYVVEARTLMTGEYIHDARVRPSSQLQGPYVELILNSTGARLFEQITGGQRQAAAGHRARQSSLFSAGDPGTDRRRQGFHYRQLRYQGGAGSGDYFARRRAAGAGRDH